MKFIRSFLPSINIKAILLLFLLLSNIYVEGSEKIKIHKTIAKYERLSAKSKSKSKIINKFGFKEKFKNFLIGFLAAIAVKIVKGGEDAGIVNKMITAAVDWCFEPTIYEYDENKKKMIKESPCDPEAIKDLLGEQYVEIQSTCEQLDTINKSDSNEFSSVKVLLNKIKGVFKDNSDFEEKYKKFKEEKYALLKTEKQLTAIYTNKFNDVKNGKTVVPENVKKVAVEMHSQMTKTFFSKNFCEALRECRPFSFMDHLKLIYTTAFGFLKCAVTAQVKNPLWYGIQALIKSIFTQLGVGILTKIAAGILPGVLLGLLIKFVVNNWGALRTFIKSYLSLKTDDPSTWKEEQDIWNSIGRLLAGIFFAIIGVRRRKLKKFRKFDTKLY